MQGKLTYKFDGYLLVVEKVGAFENDAKRALSYLFAHSVVHSNDVRRRGGHRFVDSRLGLMAKRYSKECGCRERVSAGEDKVNKEQEFEA